MRHVRRRHPSIAAAAGLMLLALSVGCATTTTTDRGDPLEGIDYVDAMNEICAATDARLDALPSPPEQISAADWAGEVSRAIRDEAVRADDLFVIDETRSVHRTFVTTTQDLAAQYDRLSAQLSADPDAIDPINTEITELSLGRDDTAASLGIAQCIRRTT